MSALYKPKVFSSNLLVYLVGNGFARARQSVGDVEVEVPERHLVAHVAREFQNRDTRGNRVVKKTAF